MSDQWSSLGADELLRAAVRCPDLGSAPSDWPERYGQALSQGLGLAFYLSTLPGHDHIEVRTYGGPHANYQAISPAGHTLARPHGTLAAFIAAFRGEDLNRARPETFPDPTHDKAQENEPSQDVTEDNEPDLVPLTEEPNGPASLHRDDYPEGTLVAGEWAGVFCIEDFRVLRQDARYISAVHAATTYGEARVAGAEVDEREHLDYYTELYVDAHPDAEDQVWDLDDDARWELVRPTDDTPFDLTEHPMWREGDWGPRPSNFGSWADEGFDRFVYGDNGGHISSIEGFDCEEAPEIVRYLRSKGHVVIAEGGLMEHYWG